MQLTTSFNRLGRNDLRLVGRDIFLIYLFVYINVLAVVMRYALPFLNDYFAAHNVMTVPLADWYPMIVAYILIFLGACLVGMIFGFVLLEEKDDQTIVAMLVSPLPLHNYLTYRVVVPWGMAFITLIWLVIVAGVAVPAFWQLVVIAAGGALAAPLATLYFAAFAENKVQGLALTKFSGIAGFLIAFAWFVPSPFQYLFGLFPPYWISKAYWLALEGSSWWMGAWLAGVVLQSGLIVWLARRFQRTVYAR